MIAFPNISPEIYSFNIGGFEVALRWYALSYIMGFILALYVMKFFLKKEHLWSYKTAPMELEQADTFLTYLILGVILGGRLGYVIFYNPEFYIENPEAILRVWDGGMAFHGGFIGVVIAVFGFCRFNGIPLLSAADLIAVSTPPGLLLGRTANFINAELWGKPTDFSLGVIFPGDRAQDCPQVVGPCARHPSQLYEAGMEGFILFIILIVLAFFGFFKRPGLIMGVFVAGYGASRYVVEFFREADPQFITFDNPLGYVYSFGGFGLSMGQFLSVPMIIVGLLMVFMSSMKKAK
jgi:phosphatidylglycerol:prolipoprotein diacylglycerol transferase